MFVAQYNLLPGLRWRTLIQEYLRRAPSSPPIRYGSFFPRQGISTCQLWARTLHGQQNYAVRPVKTNCSVMALRNCQLQAAPHNRPSPSPAQQHALLPSNSLPWLHHLTNGPTLVTPLHQRAPHISVSFLCFYCHTLPFFVNASLCTLDGFEVPQPHCFFLWFWPVYADVT